MAQTERHRWPARRWILVVAVAAAAMYLAGLLTTSVFGVRTALGTPTSPAQGQVITYDRAAADDGYVLTSVLTSKRADLMDKNGDIVHTWHLEYPVQGMVAMDPDGSLHYLGLVEQTADQPTPPPVAGAAGVLQRVAWDSTVEWTFSDSLISHDFAELPDGTIAVIKWSDLPAETVSSIAGGIPGSEDTGGRMWGDQIVEIDPTTNEERVAFDTAKAWRPADYPIPEFMARREWGHANSVFYTPSDPLTHQEAYLISYRIQSKVELVSRATGEVIWSYGGPWVLDQQHDATLLDNGHVLLFNDGQYLLDRPSASTLREIDPKTNEVVWSYQGYGVFGSNFYSPITGGAQRLPNGDTLATLGTKGQLMEVTPDGKVVWDYTVGSDIPDGAYPTEAWNMLFKSRSYPPSLVEPLLASE